jgi:hypothetical protein
MVIFCPACSFVTAIAVGISFAIGPPIKRRLWSHYFVVQGGKTETAIIGSLNPRKIRIYLRDTLLSVSAPIEDYRDQNIYRSASLAFSED